MVLVYLIFRRYLVGLMLGFSILGWSSFATYEYIFNQPKPLIIGIDANGTRIVSSPEDVIFRTEAVNFIKTFLNAQYNFNSRNFTQVIGKSTDLMSSQMWLENRDKIADLQRQVSEYEMAFEGYIEKMTKVDEGNYQALMRVKQSSRFRNQQISLVVSVGIKKSVRNSENPWGLEVTNVEEKRVE